MALQNISLEIENDGVALLTVTRPGKRNALNQHTIAELSSVMDEVTANEAIRGVIVTGAGEKAFIAGADISELAAADPIASVTLSMKGQDVFRRFETCGKPSIAAINGFALGGGLELAMACCIRVASDNAKLGQPEVKLGVIAGYGGTQRLPRLIGRGRALEMLLTGDMIDAAEAHRIGLVNHVTPQSELLDFSRGLLRRILAAGPVAVNLTIRAVDVGFEFGQEAGFRFEAHSFGLAAATEDRAEGTRAFLEKRTAKFSGK